jgi:ABC-type nitrate/sulfonate/bicarbonate transport system permease component
MPLVPVITLFVAWQAVATYLGDPLLLPKATTVLEEIWQMAVVERSLESHVIASLIRISAGFSLAVVFGVVIGLLMGMREWAEFLFDPIITFGYPIPKIAFYPVLLIVFGLGHLPKLLLVFLECLVPIIVGTYYGVKDVDENYVWSAQNFGASERQVFFDVMLPASMPYIFSGVRTALPIAVIVTVVTEMISSSAGIGFIITFNQASLDLERMFVGIIAAGLIGFVLDRLLARLRKRTLHWADSTDIGM